MQLVLNGLGISRASTTITTSYQSYMRGLSPIFSLLLPRLPMPTLDVYHGKLMLLIMEVTAFQISYVQGF